MTDALLSLSVAELRQRFEERSVSPVEVTTACFRRIIKLNPVLNAFAFMEEPLALHQAKASEARYKKGEAKGALDGIPVTIKDWFHVKGWPTRMGSLATLPVTQLDDSPPVARLREQGAVFIGKTTLPEFGHKGVTDSKIHGITRNPWNPQKTCGGSSGGGAVAAATGMGILNLGSDAGGSLRIPAAFSGVVGFKPSAGLVPSWPPSLFSSFSGVGSLTRRVEDAAAMMDVLAQPDLRDWHALPLPPPRFAETLKKPLPKKLRIAYATGINGFEMTPDVRTVFEKSIPHFSLLGSVEEIKLDAPKLIETFNRHWMAVAANLVSKLPSKALKDLDPRLAHWAQRGKALALNDYLDAERERMSLGEYFKGILDSYDLLITPTTLMTAFDAGQNMPMLKNKPWDDWTPLTYPANMAKLPAISLPIGLAADGLPVGLQIMSGYLKDSLVLQAARGLEAAFAFKGLDT